MTVKLLAFDTATEQMSVGLQVGAQQHLLDAPGGAKASAALVPAVLTLLAQAGIGVADLDAIAFGRGPGAFTGLRTACAVAQGLALGAGKPVLALDSLLAVAEEARQAVFERAPELSVWVAVDARMNEIYAAAYAWSRGRWTQRVAPLLISVEALNQRWLDAPPGVVVGNAPPGLVAGNAPPGVVVRNAPPGVVAGNALAVFEALLRPGVAVRVPGALPTARALLALARAAWQGGAALDAALALPLYLRDKVAQTTAERDAARAARLASDVSA